MADAKKKKQLKKAKKRQRGELAKLLDKRGHHAHEKKGSQKGG